MGDGLNISNLSAKAQEFIQQRNIDTDGDGKVNGTELANLLGAISENANVSGDSFSGIIKQMPPIPPLPQMVYNLIDTIVKIDVARQEDKEKFDKQSELIQNFILNIDRQGEISQEMVEDFMIQLLKGGNGYEEEVGNRYTSLDDAIYNVGVTFTDPEHPTGLRNDELIQKREDTKQRIEEFVKMQATITDEIRNLIEEGNINRIKDNCERLTEITAKFAEEMNWAMHDLIEYGTKALDYATANIPGRNTSEEMKSISKLSATIDTIMKQAKADQEEFKKFINMLEEQRAKIDGMQDTQTEAVYEQLKLMHDTLSGKVKEFAGRYDSVLEGFEKFDLDSNENLEAKAEEVKYDKKYATTNYEVNSEHLTKLVATMTEMIYHGELVENIKEVIGNILKQVYETSITNDEAMQKLESNAIEFLKEYLNNNNSTAINAPKFNGKALDVSPKKVEKDGKIVIAKPIPVNGTYVIQLSSVDGAQLGFDENVDNYPMCFK